MTPPPPTSDPPDVDDDLGWDDDPAPAAGHTGLPTDAVRVPVGDLAVGDTRMFEFERDLQPLSGFVVHHAATDDVPQGFAVYVNRCPHVPYSLDFGDGHVMCGEQKFLQCSSHGAMFLPESGECFMGPVVGRKLERMPFEVVDGGAAVEIAVPPTAPGWPRDYR